jgi:hypothetical protein
VALLVLVAIGAACGWSLTARGSDWFPGTGQPGVLDVLH